MSINFPIPVHFFIPLENDLEERLQYDPDKDWQKMRKKQRWLLQTYLRLRNAGYRVTASDEFPESGILIFHSKHEHILLHQMKYTKNRHLILVSIRADWIESQIADFELLQNRYYEDQKRLFYLPYWPQPALIPRDPSRGTRIENIAFKGFHSSLNDFFLCTEWQSWLQTHKIGWKLDSEEFGMEGEVGVEVDWHDYKEVDLVIAMRRYRNGPRYGRGYVGKPATKLYNAWHAGVPAILGPDFAYQDIRKSELDYIEIIEAEDVIKHIEYLMENPDIYTAMVKNGRKRAEEYTVEKIRDHWVNFLYKTVPEKWSNNGKTIPRIFPFKLRRAINYTNRKLARRRKR